MEDAGYGASVAYGMQPASVAYGMQPASVASGMQPAYGASVAYGMQPASVAYGAGTLHLWSCRGSPASSSLSLLHKVGIGHGMVWFGP